MTIDQHISDFMCLRRNHRSIYVETFNKHTLKIVKKESIYEVASLKSLTLLNELELSHSFFHGFC